MDLQNFVWFFIEPANLLFASIVVLKWFNFAVSLPVGLLSLLVGYAFVQGLPWGRTLGIATSLIGILINVVNLTVSQSFSPIISIITAINVVAIYYLRRPIMKKVFTPI